jgi:hypothetical protein
MLRFTSTADKIEQSDILEYPLPFADNFASKQTISFSAKQEPPVQ